MQDESQIGNEEAKTKLHSWLTKTPFQREVKKWLVEGIAVNLFYTPILAINELFVAHMTPYETLKARLISIPLGFVLGGRPYGFWRQTYARVFKTDENSGRIRKFLVDTSASLIFNGIVYTGILKSSGASWEEVGTALGSYAIFINMPFGRLYGWFLDKFSKQFGIKPTLDKIYDPNK